MWEPDDKESLTPLAMESGEAEPIEPAWEVDRGPRHGFLKAMGALAVGIPLAVFAAMVVSRGPEAGPSAASPDVPRAALEVPAPVVQAQAPAEQLPAPDPIVAPEPPKQEPAPVLVEAVPEPRAARTARAQSRPRSAAARALVVPQPRSEAAEDFPYAEVSAATQPAPASRAAASEGHGLPYEPDAL